MRPELLYPRAMDALETDFGTEGVARGPRDPSDAGLIGFDPKSAPSHRDFGSSMRKDLS
jgi:hypothetical protein